jgi:hypothetical protein
MKMPKFNVLSREVVYYSSWVEAENKEEAIKKIYDFGVKEEDFVSGEYFEIDGVYLDGVEVENEL